MSISGAYQIEGTFTGGMAGDGFTGTLAFIEDAPPDGKLRGLADFKVRIAGTEGHSVVMELDDIQVASTGAISFAVEASGGMAWTFSGYAKDGNLEGRHTLKNARLLGGPWTAKRLINPDVSELFRGMR